MPRRSSERVENAGIYPQPTDGAAVRWVNLDVGRVRCVEAGRPDAPPVVLLPGWGCSAYSFRHNLGAIAAAGFRAVVVEPPGQGWSDKPGDETAYTLSSLAANVTRVLDALDVESAAFVGQSLGGGIALRIALESPGRVTRLALWSPIGFGCRRIVHLGARLPLALAPVLERIVGPTLVGMALRIVYGRACPPGERDVEQYALPIGSPGFVRAQIALLRKVSWAAMPPADRARVAVPVSIVTGTGDPIVPTDCLADAAASLPNARLRVLSGAGHAANETHPAEVNRETLAFLGAPDATSTS